uniref:Defective in cullin neddylation protein n=1 Tax=Asterionellopsis glacialis TaxID=33640 RepID=A0A7S0KXW4_9STRA|mmetsp:Transcript_370/g.506  ORF Transcript_370/g.506 Transcript_370/m.506 type:complete len:255 (+) Transcript_370:150-914(+)
MGRSTKRKAPSHPSSAASINNNANMWNSSSGSRRHHYKSGYGQPQSKPKPTINEKEAEKLFLEYADPDDSTIASMEGISKLCDALEIDPLSDIRILVLLWKLGANEKPAEISQREWMAGCNKLQIDSLDKFKTLLPSLDTGFLAPSEFKEFYKFCFQFNRQGTHRTLDKDMVIALLGMILTEGGRIPQDRLDSFCQFLESSKSYSRITLDQWTSFLDFCLECEDLSSYDEATSAWPVLIDEYVEYMEDLQTKGK